MFIKRDNLEKYYRMESLLSLLHNSRRNIILYKNRRKGYKLEIKRLKSIGYIQKITTV